MKEITVTLRADDLAEYCRSLRYNVTDGMVEQLFDVLEVQIKYVMLAEAETFIINTIDPSHGKEGK